MLVFFQGDRTKPEITDLFKVSIDQQRIYLIVRPIAGGRAVGGEQFDDLGIDTDNIVLVSQQEIEFID